MMIQIMNAIIRLMMIATIVIAADGTSVQNIIQPHVDAVCEFQYSQYEECYACYTESASGDRPCCTVLFVIVVHVFGVLSLDFIYHFTNDRCYGVQYVCDLFGLEHFFTKTEIAVHNLIMFRYEFF